MKSTLCIFLTLASWLPGQSETNSDPGPTAARVLNPLPDGSESTAPTPAPEFPVSAADILSTTTRRQDGRNVTVQRIHPIALPEPAAPQEPTAADAATLAARRAAHPSLRLVRVGATVHRSAGNPARSLVSYWPDGAQQPILFWSSADFGLFAGVSRYLGSDGETRSLLMVWSHVDADRLAARGKSVEIPSLPEGPATFLLIQGTPDAAALADIQSIHALYQNEHSRLLTAAEGREQARLVREAALKANPPKPRDITLRYWRTETPLTAAPRKGAAR